MVVEEDESKLLAIGTTEHGRRSFHLHSLLLSTVCNDSGPLWFSSSARWR